MSLAGKKLQLELLSEIAHSPKLKCHFFPPEDLDFYKMT